MAARLEQAAGAGEVLLGETTRWLVRDVIDAQRVGPLSVKGKSEPLVAYRLVGVWPASLKPGRSRRFAGRLVGRRRQLRLAETAFEMAVEEPACVLLTVVGEAGVGKSRLVEELLARVGDQAVALAGRCLSYGEGITYWPTIEMLNRLAEADPRPVSSWLDGVEHADLIRTGLETMLGRAEAASGQEIAWAFRRLVETVAVARPVILVVDDVQWAEPALLDLLVHLTDMSRAAPILLVCMARPEFLETRPGWGAGRQALTTVLSPLSRTDCAELTAGLLGEHAGNQLLERITDAADGIPLFVEEMLAMLVDLGRLVSHPAGGWTATADLADSTVPATVQALLAARLDQLPSQVRTVIDAASVIGKTFYPDAVAVLLNRAPGMSESIQALVRADLIAATATDLPGHDAYTFTHLLTRDTAYGMLPKTRRAGLHLALARWLQQAPGGAVSPEVVAFHLEQAATYGAQLGHLDLALAEEAAGLLLAGADRAMELGDVSAAGALARRAELLALSDSRLRAEITLTRSRMAHRAGHHEEALRLAEGAERIGATFGDLAMQWRARLQTSWVRVYFDPSYRIDDVFALVEPAIEHLTTVDDDIGLTHAFALRALAHSSLGQVRAASADAMQGLRHAHRVHHAGGYRDELLDKIMAPSYFGDGSLTEMEQTIDKVTADFGGDTGVDQSLAKHRPSLLAFRGRLEDAIDARREQCQLALERGDERTAARWLAETLSLYQRWSGDLTGAVATLTTAQSMGEGLGETGNRSTTLATLALVLVQLGRHGEAESALGSSRMISGRDDVVNEILYATTEGLLLAHRGDSEGSERRFAAGLRLVASTEFLLLQGELFLNRSLARKQLGDMDGALTAARDAQDCFRRKEFIPPIQMAQARITELAG